jgi:hypothetical protein
VATTLLIIIIILFNLKVNLINIVAVNLAKSLGVDQSLRIRPFIHKLVSPAGTTPLIGRDHVPRVFAKQDFVVLAAVFFQDLVR